MEGVLSGEALKKRLRFPHHERCIGQKAAANDTRLAHRAASSTATSKHKLNTIPFRTNPDAAPTAPARGAVACRDTTDQRAAHWHPRAGPNHRQPIATGRSPEVWRGGAPPRSRVRGLRPTPWPARRPGSSADKTSRDGTWAGASSRPAHRTSGTGCPPLRTGCTVPLPPQESDRRLNQSRWSIHGRRSWRSDGDGGGTGCRCTSSPPDFATIIASICWACLFNRNRPAISDCSAA